MSVIDLVYTPTERRRALEWAMRAWTPQSWYDAKPWVLCATGAVLGIGMVAWSLWAGWWTAWRGLLCFAGAALSIIGGAMLQLRQDYRARSKWRRENGP